MLSQTLKWSKNEKIFRIFQTHVAIFLQISFKYEIFRVGFTRINLIITIRILIYIFQALTSEQNQDNVVCSSMSAHIILALLFHGADGVTKDELKTGLHLSDSNQLQRDVKYLFELLNVSTYDKNDIND